VKQGFKSGLGQAVNILGNESSALPKTDKVPIFWRTLVAGTVLLGLLYIPSDIKGLPEALRAPLGFVVTYMETLILLYAVALTLWIAWRDARPLKTAYCNAFW
jgi:hypothetical protein